MKSFIDFDKKTPGPLASLLIKNLDLLMTSSCSHLQGEKDVQAYSL